MALFVKKLSYRASMTSYLAVLVLAKKKGGKPIEFIAYGHNIDGRPFVMQSFQTFDEAEKACSRYWEIAEFNTTTPWLHHVAAGGSYEQFPKVVWVRVPVPKKRCRWKKKRQIQIGDLGALYRLAKQEHHLIENELSSTSGEILCMEHNLEQGYEEDENVLEGLRLSEALLQEETEYARIKVMNIRCEMEHARSRRTGIPISPNSWGNMKMRASD